MTVNKPLKFLLFTFNLLFFLGGAIILLFSVQVRSNTADYQITDELLPAVNLLIVVGAVAQIFGFLGCCGAIWENRCLLVLFFLGLLGMLFMLLAVGALGAVSRTKAAQEVVRKQMQQLLPLRQQPKELQESFQNVERNGFCCGFFVGHLDWGNSTVVPHSCNCTDSSRSCMDLDGREIYSTPCITYIMTWLDRLSDSFVAIAFTFGVMMILGMALSFALLCQIIRKNGIV